MPTTQSATLLDFLRHRHRGRIRLLVVCLAGLVAWLAIERLLADRRPVVVGLLHSITGADAPHEKPLLDAEVAALSELNAAGGLLGRPIRWVIADGGSDPQAFARQAARLIRDEQACVLIGSWRTADRKAVVRVVESNDHLLVYPGLYEGLEQSPNVVYTGPVPNQFLGPAVHWLREDLAVKRFYLVGADDLWGRAVEAFADDLIAGLGGEIVGRATIANDGDLASAVAAITAGRTDAVISTLEWPVTAQISRTLRGAGVRAETLPILALPFGAPRFPARDSIAGIYTITAAGTGGAVLPGADTAHADAGAVTAIRLWAQAVRDADTTDVRQVRDAMRHQSLATPDGILAVDPGTQHTWHRLSVARIRADGRLDGVSSSPTTALRPVPFPMSRSRAQWDQMTATLFRRWGGAWGRTTSPSALPPAPTMDQGDSR